MNMNLFTSFKFSVVSVLCYLCSLLKAALRHCICAEEGSVLMRATILAQLEMQGFNEVSHMSLGMSLKREFPGVIRFGRRSV